MIKKIALVTMMLCISVASKAYDFKDGECYFTIISLSDLTVALTNSGEIVSSEYYWETQYAACYSGDFVVPQTAEYSGKTFTVTSIEDIAFQNCSLNTLTIPSSVLTASISGNVQKLIIEDGSNPLSDLDAKSVKEVYMGRNISVPWNHLVYCFSYSNIEKIVFGDSVTYVPGGMLGDCPQLVSVELSSNVKEIYNKAFENCTNLKTISGDNVEFIETGAFGNCTSLESFYFPNLITIDDGDSQWGTYRWGVFQGCTSLKNVELPDGLIKIGTMAFMDCTSLESVKIPGTIATIGYGYDDYGYVFANCPKLEVVSIAAKKPIYLPESSFDAQRYINATLKVPAGTLDAYKNAEIWKNFFNIKEDASLITSACVVTVTNHSSEYGTVEFLNKTVDSYNPITSKVSVGETITLQFNPKNGYCVKSVRINDADWTSKIVNNSLTIEKIEENIIVEVLFEEEPIYLTIKQADNGSVKLKIYKWEEYKFMFSPESGWDIHSVSFNGEDVTENLGDDNSFVTPEMVSNSELIVTYIERTNAIYGINSNHSNTKVVGINGNIIVSNAMEGDPIIVYSLSGKLLHSSIASYGNTIVNLGKNQVYIVRVGNMSFKIGL